MIKGRNIGLRAVEKSDLKQLKEWRNISSFRRNFREHKELCDEIQLKWFERMIESSSDYMFVIIDLNSNNLIGACGLLYINWITRTSDFSFYIGEDESYMNHPLANEAIEVLLNYGFGNLNLNKIWMELYEFDHPKLETFVEKFGFNIDGKLRMNCFEDGQYWDSYVLSILKNEFFKTKE